MRVTHRVWENEEFCFSKFKAEIRSRSSKFEHSNERAEKFSSFIVFFHKKKLMM